MGLAIHCPHCHGARFLVPPQPRRDEYVTCAGCGERAKYGCLEDEAVREVRALLARDFPELAAVRY